MFNEIFSKKAEEAYIPIQPILANHFTAWLKNESDFIKNWLDAVAFKNKSGSIAILPDKNGEVSKVIIILASLDDWWVFGALAESLPPLNYKLVKGTLAQKDYEGIIFNALFAWALGSYRFDRYKKNSAKKPKLFLPKTQDEKYLKNVVTSIYWVRELINLPAQDLGPEELEKEAINLAKEYGAKLKQVVGNKLIRENFPAIYTVGKGSSRAPRLIDFSWGKKSNPKITLVGKGVCFDSGGLCLKPSIHMRTMKKDMAGAAHALGLARMIMESNLPVSLRVIVPAVENLISGTSYKPGDIINTRSGKTVEVHDTDAEGRLILADALTLASEDKPQILIDFASLTGAARVALGPDITAMFTENDKLANDLLAATNASGESLWRLPLHKPYRSYLESKFADMANISSVPVGGSITAALFLQEFVADVKDWIHLDLGAYNERTRPGHPEGAEAYCLRGIFEYLKRKFGTN